MQQGRAADPCLAFVHTIQYGAPMSVAHAVDGCVSAAFVLLAALHVCWGIGITWPSTDRQGLALAVVGRRALPGRVACFVVAVGLAAMAAVIAADVIGPLRWLIAAVFLARGTVGFVERWLRPEIRGTPYAIYSAAFYTPLALCLGVAVGLGG